MSDSFDVLLNYDKSETEERISIDRKHTLLENDGQPTTPVSSTSLGEDLDLLEDMVPVVEHRLFSPMIDSGLDDLGFRCCSEATEIAMMVGNDQDFIWIAQLVADQAAFRPDTPNSGVTNIIALQRDLNDSLNECCFSRENYSKQCTLKEFLEVDVQNHSSMARDQKPLPPLRAPPMPSQSLFKLQAPYASVQRTGTAMDIAASALPFWEELSLGPCHDNKNITAYCIFPDKPKMEDNVITFLGMIRGAYQSCKLGLHNLGSNPARRASGLIPVPMEFDGRQKAAPETRQAFEAFGKWLGKSKLQGSNTVIYLVSCSNDQHYLPALCTAFLILYNAYKAAVREAKAERPNDLVLQSISLSLVYSSTGLPMPSLADYRKLAFEVYNRCPSDRKSGPPYICAPSTRLSKSLPKTIDFRLTADNSVLSLQSDNCLHIGYAWTPGEHWLTASWTDNLGNLCWTSCYYFGKEPNTPWRCLSEIVREIWETTIEMLQPRNALWQIFVSKDGIVRKEELEGESTEGLH